jgi:hypothetical protein
MAVIALGLLAPAAVPMMAMQWSGSTPAAQVNCGTHANPKTLGPYTVNSYIVAYGDPACTGNRYRAYDHYGLASAAITEIDFSPYRGWDCGTLYYNLTAQITNSNELNKWPGWLPNTTCGWQADQNARFHLTGYPDTWSYVNW